MLLFTSTRRTYITAAVLLSRCDLTVNFHTNLWTTPITTFTVTSISVESRITHTEDLHGNKRKSLHLAVVSITCCNKMAFYWQLSNHFHSQCHNTVHILYLWPVSWTTLDTSVPIHRVQCPSVCQVRRGPYEYLSCLKTRHWVKRKDAGSSSKAS